MQPTRQNEQAAEAAAENAALWLELTDIDEVLVNICRCLGLRELGRQSLEAGDTVDRVQDGGVLCDQHKLVRGACA